MTEIRVGQEMEVSVPDDTKLHILMAYLSRGWSLVPLHDVSAGRCSCDAGETCTSAGKHPRYARWQEGRQQVRDPVQLAAVVQHHPEWNWGLATGPASGVWVLDYDPAHAGEQAHEIMQALEGGRDTRVHGTGSGGTHLIWALDARTARHGNGRGQLPAGLDVRGEGGQVVLPPSVSGKGAYRVLVDSAPQPAPAWLVELIVGDERERQREPVAIGGNGGPGEATGSRGAQYANSAVTALLGELAGAPVGTRNDTAFRVACRLIELANAGWSQLSIEQAHSAWWAAASEHPDGAYVPVAELDGVWRSASARVGDVAATLPPRLDGGDFIPFSPAGAASGGQPAAPVTDPVQALIDAMLTPEQLRLMPPPEPLINGVLDLDTCAWLIGPPGSYKSFVAIDFAAHVGRGETWRGHATHQGLVVYIAAEGSRGMRLRADAWEREYGPLKELRILPMPIQSDERRVTPGGWSWSVLVEACRRLQPVMIVIDTQARVTVGLNENDNAEMGYFAEQADRLKRATQACVLIVHHTGRVGTNARGASAIDGAQDAELRCEKMSALRLRLHMDKQKDQIEEAPRDIMLRRSDGGTDERTGRDLSSLVLVRSDPNDPFLDPEVPVDRRSQRMAALYRILLEGNVGDGMTRADIKKAFFALPDISAMKPASREVQLRKAWNGDDGMPGLVPRGLIAKRAGAERFKVIVLPDQSSEGVLTSNPKNDGFPPPAGWNVWWPDEEVATRSDYGKWDK